MFVAVATSLTATWAPSGHGECVRMGWDGMATSVNIQSSGMRNDHNV